LCGFGTAKANALGASFSRDIKSAAPGNPLLLEWHQADRGALLPRPQAGYPCLSLHGGKDQSDRESTIADYKSGVGNILVATSGESSSAFFWRAGRLHRHLPVLFCTLLETCVNI
jgi:hypothetical protein